MEKERAGFEITRLAFNDDGRRILMLTSDKPVTVKEIAHLLGIPLSSCYRRVSELVSRGLLISQGVDKNGASLYRSNLRAFRIKLEDSGLLIRVDYEDGDHRDFSYIVEHTAASV